MAKNSIRDYDNTSGNNTDIQSVDISEGCSPAGINNALREILADLADVNDGTVALVSPAMDSADINGGTIDGTVIGGTTPAAGTFTTGDFNTSLNVDGTVTADGLTVDGSVDVNGATSFNLQTTGTNYVFNRTDAAPVLATQYNGTTNAQVFTGTDGSLSLRADPTDNLSGSYFNITVDGTTALTIDDSQNVGIGTSSISSLGTGITTLELKGNSASQTDRSGGIRFTRYDGSDGMYIYNADGASYIESRSTYPLLITTNGTERLRVKSDGDVLIAQTTDDGNTVGHIFANDGIAFHIRDGGACQVLNRKSSDGDIQLFRKDGSTVGSISTISSTMYLGTGDCALRFHDTSLNMRPVYSTGLNRDNAIDLGTSSARFDDIYATNGTIQTSDQNEKNTITDSDLGLDFIGRLAPKSYIFNNKTRTHYGLIAQDVESVLSDIGKTTSEFAGFIKADISDDQDGSSYRYGLRYTEFVGPLIQAVKELKTKVETLETENATQATQIADLITRVTALEAN